MALLVGLTLLRERPIYPRTDSTLAGIRFDSVERKKQFMRRKGEDEISRRASVVADDARGGQEERTK
jgi:hypothetical protein